MFEWFMSMRWEDVNDLNDLDQEKKNQKDK